MSMTFNRKYLSIEIFCIDEDVTPLENLLERETTEETWWIARRMVLCLLLKVN